MLNVALLGVTGRMGNTLVRAVVDSDDCRLSGALTSTSNPARGRDAGLLIGSETVGVTVTDRIETALDGADVAIDFTLAAVAPANVEACRTAGCPAVIGVTGLSDATNELIGQAAETIPMVVAANMSVGVNLALRLAELAAATLGEDYDAEIVEVHHRGKRDAPSGTALELGHAVARGRGVELADRAVYTRHGLSEPRARGTIGISSVRAGDVVGEHRLLLAAPGESLEIGHRATDRMTFAAGALRAARWVVSQTPGRYGMADVLGV